MSSRAGRWMSMVGAAAFAVSLIPVATPVQAQGWDNSRSCRGLDGRDRDRCERERSRWDRRDDRRGGRWDDRRERERERRKDAKTDGIIAGVVGTAVLGGIIAAVATSGKKKDKSRDRREYCESRYGNYDERNDSYRATDGRWYQCQ